MPFGIAAFISSSGRLKVGTMCLLQNEFNGEIVAFTDAS